MFAPFDAVLFDRDGTLGDTAPDLLAHVNAVLGELRRPQIALSDVRPMIGHGAATLIRRGLEATGGVPAGARWPLLKRAAPGRSAGPAGMVEAVQTLRAPAIGLGVCTDKLRAPTGRLLAAPVQLPLVLGFTAILCIALGAGAAGALNQWYEADLDAKMRRTANRPLPAKRMERQTALHFGVGLSVFSVILMDLATNHLAAILLAISILFYVLVYTVWLKRRTRSRRHRFAISERLVGTSASVRVAGTSGSKK